MQQSDSEPADFSRHGWDGAASTGDDFGGNRQVKSLSSSFVVAIGFADALKYLFQMLFFAF